jgi:serine/threonine protein kinase
VQQANQKLDQSNEKLDRTNQMLEALLQRMGLSESRQVQALDIASRDDPTNRQQVEQVRQQVHALGAGRQVSRVYSKLGKAELLTGNLEAAWQEFSSAAEMADDPAEKATAHYHLYRIALERNGLSGKSEDLDAALNQLKLAINKDRDKSGWPFDVRKYQPVRILGAGGFGVTFLCKRKPLLDLVAVKAVSQENLERSSDEVFKEGMLLRELDHPAIIRMIDGDYVDAERKVNPYFVMDFFDGTTLEEHVKKNGSLPAEDVIELGLRIAEGLQAAHDRDIWHRDIKPANVMVKKADGGWRVKIIDFGLALRRDLQTGKNVRTSKKGKSTLNKVLAYTEDYGAPEQKDPDRQHEIGPRTDIFCFGKTIYYALFQTPRPDYADIETLPASLKRLLTGCAAERLDRRPQNFAEVIQELKKVEFELAPVMEVLEEEPVPVVALPAAVPMPAAVPVEAREWFYMHAGQQAGPVTEGELVGLLQQLKVLGTDVVWKKSLAGWVAAATAFPAVAAAVPAAPPPVVPATNEEVNVEIVVPARSIGWGERLNIGETTYKYYLDEEFVGEGTSVQGTKLSFPATLGRHMMKVIALNRKGKQIGLCTKEIQFARGADFEIRFTPIVIDGSMGDWFKNFNNSSLEVMRKTRRT